MFIFGDCHLISQNDRFGNIQFDEIYDYSEINNVLTKFNQQLNFDYKLKKINATTKKESLTKNVADFYPDEFKNVGIPNYKYFYDDDLIEKVAFIYKDDIDRFGFTFDSGYTGS